MELVWATRHGLGHITNEVIQNHFPFDINDFGIEVEVDAEDSGPTSKVTREKKKTNE